MARIQFTRLPLPQGVVALDFLVGLEKRIDQIRRMARLEDGLDAHCVLSVIANCSARRRPGTVSFNLCFLGVPPKRNASFSAFRVFAKLGPSKQLCASHTSRTVSNVVVSVPVNRVRKREQEGRAD